MSQNPNYLCWYCGKSFDKKTEHLVSRCVSNINKYVDFVCPDCNQSFSKFESELSKGFELARVGKNFEKRKNKKTPSAAFQDSLNLGTSFIYSRELGFYELVEMDSLMKPIVLPQVIFDIKNCKLIYVHFDTNFNYISESKKLCDFFKDKVFCYKANRLHTKKKTKLKYHKKNQNCILIKKAQSNAENFNEKFPPRLVINKKGEIEFWIGNDSDLDVILKHLKAFCHIDLANSDSPETFITEHPHVSIQSSIHLGYSAKALLKNSLNVLFFYRPELITSEKFYPLKDFINTNEDLFIDNTNCKVFPCVTGDYKLPLLDTKNQHFIYFSQVGNQVFIYVGFLGFINCVAILKNVPNLLLENYIFMANPFNGTHNFITDLQYSQLISEAQNPNLKES